MKSSNPLDSSMKESVRPLVASAALASWTSFADSRMEPVARENALSSRSVADSTQRAIDSEIDVAALVISHMRSRRNALSPIFVLPEDVLALIFERVSRSHPFFSPPLLESWLSITFVCRVWRQIALSHPRLWRDIPIGPHPKWAELFLERSKATPIVFLVLPPFSEYPIVFEFMQNHLWHTDAIYFEGHVSEVERLAQIIASGAPILEALNLKVTDVGYTRQGTQIVSASVIKSAPKLHTLRIANTPLLSWNILPWANLKCLEIESSNIPDLPTLLRGLGSALQLEDLKFTDLERIPQFVGNEGIQNAKLERLKSLVIGGTLEDCVTLWNVLDVPATVSLHILVTLSRTGQYRANAVVPLLRKHLDRAISARLPPIQVLQIKETRSVGLPLDGISFTAWRSVGSASDPFAPPEDCPRIKLDLFNTSYSNAQWCLQDVQTLCRIIQFDGLHALSVSLRKESWQKKSWVSIFGSAKHLQDLEVHGRAAYSLAKALVPTIQNVPDENMPQPGPSSARGRGRGRGGKNQKVKRTQVHGPIFLPELRSLRFKTVRFDVNYEGKAFCKKLPIWIKQRLASPGNKVATLELRDCVVQEQNVADLRRIQGLQVEWDGREGEPDMDHIIPHEVYQDSIYDELDYLDDDYMGYYDDTWQGHDFDDFDDSLYYHQY